MNPIFVTLWALDKFYFFSILSHFHMFLRFIGGQKLGPIKSNTGGTPVNDQNGFGRGRLRYANCYSYKCFQSHREE